MVRVSRPFTTRVLAGCGLLLGLGTAAAPRAEAQSLGLEAGVTSAESFEAVRPTLGLSLFLPLTERLRIAASGTQWTGCPESGCAEPRTGYGNRGLNLLGMFTALDGARTDLSLGAGMGWYEMRRPDEGGSGSDARYDEAVTFAAELRRAVAYNSGMYLRGETSFPTDDGAARWSSLRLGVDVRLF